MPVVVLDTNILISALLYIFIAHPRGGDEGCILEVFNAVGESIAVITVPISQVETLRSDEILTISWQK